MHFFCSPFVAIWRSGMIDRLFNLSHTKSCEILSAGCAFFPDASIDEQLGMIALPVGDRSVGNERAGVRSVRAFEPTEPLKQVGQYKISFCRFTKVATGKQHFVSTAVPRRVPSTESRRYSPLERWSEANRNYE